MTDRGWVAAGRPAASTPIGVWIQSDPGALRAPTRPLAGGACRPSSSAATDGATTKTCRTVERRSRPRPGLARGRRLARARAALSARWASCSVPRTRSARAHRGESWTPWFGRPVTGPVPRAAACGTSSYRGKFFSDVLPSRSASGRWARATRSCPRPCSGAATAVVGFLQGLFTADGTVREQSEDQQRRGSRSPRRAGSCSGACSSCSSTSGSRAVLMDRSRGAS